MGGEGGAINEGEPVSRPIPMEFRAPRSQRGSPQLHIGILKLRFWTPAKLWISQASPKFSERGRQTVGVRTLWTFHLQTD